MCQTTRIINNLELPEAIQLIFYLIRKILQLAEANMPGEVQLWLQRLVDVEEASQDGSAG